MAARSATHRNTWVLVVGRRCAGKTALGQHLARDAGFLHIEASDVMLQILAASANPETPIDEFAAHALSTTPFCVPDAIRATGLCSNRQPTVVTGFRSPLEVSRMRALIGQADTPVLFVSAPFEIRQRRCASRLRDGMRADEPDQLRKQDTLHESMGLLRILDLPAVVIVPNDSSLQALFARVDDLLGIT